ERCARLEAATGLPPGHPGAPLRVDAGTDGARDEAVWPLGEVEMALAALSAGVTLPGGPWPEATKQAAVLKIATPGHAPYGYLVAGISPRRGFDDDYGAFFHLLGATIASAIAGVQAL